MDQPERSRRDDHPPEGRPQAPRLLAYKPEHAVDLDTGAVIAAAIHSADRGDTTTLADTLRATARGLEAAGHTASAETPRELVADKGDHSRAVLKDLAGGPWRRRIAAPKPNRAGPGRGWRVASAAASLSRPA